MLHFHDKYTRRASYVLTIFKYEDVDDDEIDGVESHNQGQGVQ